MAWIGAAISVAGSLLSSSMQGDAAGDASGAQAEGTRLGVEEQRRQFDLNRRDLAPWRNTGAAAVNRLGVLMGLQPNANASPSARQSWQSLYDAALQRAPRIESEAAGQWVQDPLFGDVGAAPMVWRQGGTATTADANWARTEADRQFSAQNAATTSAAPDAGYGDLNRRFTLSDFWDDPVTQASYQFGLDEGRRALNNMAGARGNRNSGAQVRALTRFGTDYTGQRAGESYSRFYGDQDRTSTDCPVLRGRVRLRRPTRRCWGRVQPTTCRTSCQPKETQGVLLR